MKNCAVLPLAAFIRNRQDGGLDRLTFNKTGLPSGHPALLKNGHVANFKIMVELKEGLIGNLINSF